MRTGTVVERFGGWDVDPARGPLPAVIVTCVHGTWARASRWSELEQSIAEVLGDCGPVAFRYFQWSGRNSVKARTRAVADLRRFLRQEIQQAPGARHVLVAHSHGANIVLHALDRAGRDIRDAVAGVALLSPPLLDCAVIDDAEAAANKLLLGALGVVPLLAAASRYARLELGFSRPAALVALAIVTMLWLALFRPARVRRRAETLARQLALPRLDLPGLVVRGPRDEATAVLSAVEVFTTLTRYAWSKVLRLRPPVHRHTEQSLREARGFGLAVALSEAWVLVPMTFTALALMQDAAEGGRWLTFGVGLPVTLLFLTAAVAIVGGAMLLLVMLPVFSFLLWAFGVFPTTAAALLTVSVEEAPTTRWRVVHLVQNRVSEPSVWKHSTYTDRTSIDVVCTYVRDVVHLRQGYQEQVV